MQTPCAIDHVQPVDYQQRRPERSTLYQVVTQHVQTLFAEAELNGPGYPTHVKREFERYLRCGQFCCGFARVRCGGCGFERLVPYSCKGRSLCPSCVARRMADTAAHLPYRLWTLSLPRGIRVRVVREPALLTKVLQSFLRTVFAYQRRRARALGIARPQTAAGRPWAQLLARIFDRQVLVCPHCQGPMNRIQLVEDPAVIHRVLTHLGLPSALPPVAPARDPPQLEHDLDDCWFDP